MDGRAATPRARAAWAFSGLAQPELAERAGLHYDRLRAIIRAGNDKDVSLEELYAIADATGVPRDFMDNGWQPALAERVEQLESAQRLLEARLAVLEAEARRQSEPADRASGGQAQ